MIKKLKIKFILTNMVLITFVMLLAFTILYFNSAKELEQNSIEALKDISHSNQDELGKLFGGDSTKSKYSHLSTYILDIDNRTNNCYIDGFGDTENLTEENIAYINNLISAVHSSGGDIGVLKQYNLRFYCRDISFIERIVLLDKQYEDDNLRQLLVSFLISGSIAFVAFLIISLIVANIAVKPIEKSLLQQKRLISDVSHELKTPITVIATNTDLVLSHQDSTIEDEQKWLGYIKDETVRMSELVNMMLYLAKSDESEKKPELYNLNLSNLVYEIALPFESICYEKGKTFDIDVEPEVLVKGDEASLKQLLAILLDNAVKYSNENGRISVSLHKKADKAILSVFNTGEPIPKENIPLLFERFYRIDKARSRDNGGSGLGLSIAKRIIENNEANISVLSNQENGNLFTCTLKILKNNKKDIIDL